MITEASRGRSVGFEVETIFSLKDPKEHDDYEIKGYIKC
jgi:hypothetical protein